MTFGPVVVTMVGTVAEINIGIARIAGVELPGISVHMELGIIQMDVQRDSGIIGMYGGNTCIVPEHLPPLPPAMVLGAADGAWQDFIVEPLSDSCHHCPAYGFVNGRVVTDALQDTMCTSMTYISPAVTSW